MRAQLGQDRRAACPTRTSNEPAMKRKSPGTICVPCAQKPEIPAGTGQIMLLIAQLPHGDLKVRIRIHLICIRRKVPVKTCSTSVINRLPQHLAEETRPTVQSHVGIGSVDDRKRSRPTVDRHVALAAVVDHKIRCDGWVNGIDKTLPAYVHRGAIA